MKIKDLAKTTMAAAILAAAVSVIPRGIAEAKDKIVYDEYSGVYMVVKDDAKKEKADKLPSASARKKYAKIAKYFDWETMSSSWNTTKKTKAKKSLYSISEKYDGWMFVGKLSELRAAMKDPSVKYICCIGTTDSTWLGEKEIPETDGTGDKTLIVCSGNLRNRADWKEIWILGTKDFTELAGGNTIIRYDGLSYQAGGNVTIGEGTKGTVIRYSDVARKNAEKNLAALDKARKKGVYYKPEASAITVGANAEVSIDAANAPFIGKLTAGKKSRITFTGNIFSLRGDASADVTIDGCSWLVADIPVTVTEKAEEDWSMKCAADCIELLYDHPEGLTGKKYNYIKLNAGGTVNMQGYGTVLDLYDVSDPKKVRINSPDEDSLPFVQTTYKERLTPETLTKYLPVVYVGGKKADSMLVASTGIKAMFAAFDEIGLKESDTKEEKVRKLVEWGYEYCWHCDNTSFSNTYKSDRDLFSQATSESPYDGEGIGYQFDETFYLCVTGCNVINEVMVTVLHYLGVESYAVYEADTYHHGFNIVQLSDGKWYFADFCPRTSADNFIGATEGSHPWELSDTAAITCSGIWNAATPEGCAEDGKHIGSRYLHFQHGTIKPDGEEAGQGSYYENDLVDGCGLEFGTLYGEYTAVYEPDSELTYEVPERYRNGTYTPPIKPKDRKILGFTTMNNCDHFGEDEKAYFMVYSEVNELLYYIDKDGNTVPATSPFKERCTISENTLHVRTDECYSDKPVREWKLENGKIVWLD